MIISSVIIHGSSHYTKLARGRIQGGNALVSSPGVLLGLKVGWTHHSGQTMVSRVEFQENYGVRSGIHAAGLGVRAVLGYLSLVDSGLFVVVVVRMPLNLLLVLPLFLVRKGRLFLVVELCVLGRSWNRVRGAVSWRSDSLVRDTSWVRGLVSCVLLEVPTVSVAPLL